jgi:hypothetical protein
VTLDDMRIELGAMLDPQDIPFSWTPRQLEAYEMRRSWFRAKIQDATNAMQTLANVEPKIAADEKWRLDLNTWRPILARELVDLKGPDRGRAMNLTWSLQCIDRGIRVLEDSGWQLETTRLGELMRQSGYVQSAPEPGTNQILGKLGWFGSLPDVERRLQELAKERADAQVRLANALRDPAPVLAESRDSARL